MLPTSYIKVFLLMRFIICSLVTAHADAAYIIHSSRVCCRLISRFIIQPVNCVTFRKEGSAAMGLTKALLVLRLAGFPPLHQLFALVCLVFVIYKFITLVALRQKVLQDFETFIGPPGHWLFGHTFEFKQDGDDLHTIVEYGKQYPYAFPLRFGPFACFLTIHHPDYAKTILGSTAPKDDLTVSFIEPWIGNGLLFSNGPRWFKHRRLLTPGFHYDVLKPYVGLMSDSAKDMLHKWECYANTDKPFELFEALSLMTLDTIMKCAFSYKSNCQTKSETNTYIKSIFKLTQLINLRLRTFPYHSDFIFYLSPHGYSYRKACRMARTHTEEVIRKRKEILKEEKGLEQICTKRYLDFLDIILLARDENQQGLSDDDIRAEVDTFMFEGHDTTASALSFIFYSLACNPEHQQRCRDEVMQVLDGRDNLDWEDLSKIPYTTMCIKESLRLYSPVPAISRQLTKPMTFCDGRTLPAGCLIGISIFGIHRNASVWENPDVYDPLRFLPENISKRSPHAFVPFSAGSRNCIGQTFAMNELKVVTALTLNKYQLIEDPALKPKLLPRLILRSINGIHIKIKSLDEQE
ncbi:cytochrome P450 4B1-like [Nelusetta ayraudi]|uniref:cytochrome P450 4B1-like n=1 Tax=Nelusetta ayraudi TaxID=303726 RepID=UPI003F6FFFC0